MPPNSVNASRAFSMPRSTSANTSRPSPRSIKNNETFDRFGGHTAKGRYHWELPWPKRDLKKSKEELQKSIDKHPEHLRNYLFLAETLLKDGDAKAAKVQVDKVLNGDAAYDPPESRRVKGWAKDVAAQIDKELN